LSNFLSRQTVGERSAAASVPKTATLLGISRASVSEVMTANTHHGKTSSAKRNNGRKPKLNDRDRRALKRTVSKNHRTTAAQGTVELNIHLEDRFHKNRPTRA
jgi:predicted transcriptional regulator